MQLSSLLKSLLSLVAGVLFQGCAPTQITANQSTAHLPTLDKKQLMEELEEVIFDARLGLSYQTEKGKTADVFFAALIAKDDIAPSIATQILLAQHYRSGIDFTSYENNVDLHRALYWYEKAAALGNVEAQFNVACLTYKMRQEKVFASLPEPQRSFKVVTYMQQAAESGLVLAQLDLSSLYQHGIGIETDAVAAKRWLDRAKQSLAEGYTQSIDVQPDNNQSASKSGIYTGTSEPWYLLPRDSRDWFNNGTDALKTIDISTPEGQNAYITRYLRSGYCSPADDL